MTDDVPLIRSVTFDGEGGLSVEYMHEFDMRRNGLAIQHLMVIPGNSEYDADVDEVRDVVAALVKRGLSDLQRIPAASWEEPSADSVPGPYDNPADNYVE